MKKIVRSYNILLLVMLFLFSVNAYSYEVRCADGPYKVNGQTYESKKVWSFSEKEYGCATFRLNGTVQGKNNSSVQVHFVKKGKEHLVNDSPDKWTTDHLSPRDLTVQTHVGGIRYIKFISNLSNGKISSHDSGTKSESFESCYKSSDPNCETVSRSLSMTSETSSDYSHLLTNADTLYDEYGDQCKNYRNYSSNCCQNPRSCADKPDFGDDDLNSGSVNVANGLMKFQTMAEQFTAMGTMAGIGNMCNAMKGLHTFGALVNAGMVGMCSGARKKCSSSCEDTFSKAESQFQEVFAKAGLPAPSEYKKAKCKFDSATTKLTDDQRSNIGTACGRLLTVLQKSQNNIKTCDNLKNSQALNLMSAGTSAVLVNKFAQCNLDITTASTGFENAAAVFNGDCTSAANMSNPLCVKCNSNPNDAGCENIVTMGLTNRAGSDGAITDDVFASGLDGELNGVGTGMVDPDMPELSDLASIEAGQASVNPIAGGGGSGPTGGDGDFGLASSGDGGAGGPAPSGLDTDILTGERGGSGYSVSSMGVSESGGFSGYGGTSDVNPDNGMDMVGFMDKVTKQALDEEFGRKPAGLSLPKKQTVLGMMQDRDKMGIGFKHDNIFSMVRRTYKELCMDKYFFTCRPDYANFNYYRHVQFWVGVHMHTLNSYIKKGVKHPTKTEMWLKFITEKEDFLVKYWDKSYQKKFSVQKYKKGQVQKVTTPICHYDDNTCIKSKYRPFVYIGSPEKIDRNRVPLIPRKKWDPDLIYTPQKTAQK